MTTQLRRPGRTISIFMFVSIISCGVLIYGYWHSVTHASFHATVHLIDANSQKLKDMPLAKVDFLNATGKKLASGFSDENHNFVHLVHPEVGDCHELESAATTSRNGRSEWQECFAVMSTWIPKWADMVKQVDVVYQGQTFSEIPVSVSAYNSDWFYWWVPLPHIGGKPYTYYRARIIVDIEK